MTPPLVDIAADVREAERVEAVARALWEAQEGVTVAPWDELSPTTPTRDVYRRLARAAISADPGPDTDVVSEANRLVDAITDEQAADVAAALSSPGPDTADQLLQRVHDLADELRAPDLIAQLLAEHEFSEHAAGNGYTEPREAWAECSCGVTLFAWQQFYDEGDDRVPHREYAAHIAVLARDLAADRLRTALASALPDTTKD